MEKRIWVQIEQIKVKNNDMTKVNFLIKYVVMKVVVMFDFPMKVGSQILSLENTFSASRD